MYDCAKQHQVQKRSNSKYNRPGKSGQEDPARGMSTTKSHLFIYLFIQKAPSA